MGKRYFFMKRQGSLLDEDLYWTVEDERLHNSRLPLVRLAKNVDIVVEKVVQESCVQFFKGVFFFKKKVEEREGEEEKLQKL